MTYRTKQTNDAEKKSSKMDIATINLAYYLRMYQNAQKNEDDEAKAYWATMILCQLSDIEDTCKRSSAFAKKWEEWKNANQTAYSEAYQIEHMQHAVPHAYGRGIGKATAADFSEKAISILTKNPPKYGWGGQNDEFTDCSGFVLRCLAELEIYLPDMNAQALFNNFALKDGTRPIKVRLENLKPGDLIFYGRRYAADLFHVTHVAIYIGNGEAVSPIGNVEVNPDGTYETWGPGLMLHPWNYEKCGEILGYGRLPYFRR
ncbi:MAG: NlpC/P60 family protein [Candidatus Micrarchaeia archaeon]